MHDNTMSETIQKDIEVHFKDYDLGDSSERGAYGTWDTFTSDVEGFANNVTVEEYEQNYIYMGYCKDDPYGRSAHIETTDGKVLGSVPSYSFNAYKAWAKGRCFPCVVNGMLRRNSDGSLSLTAKFVAVKAL